MINLQINSIFSTLIPEQICQSTAIKVIDQLSSHQEQDISIVLEDDVFIQKLNLEFLGVDAPTDVLSFTANEIDPETNRLYLGDIIISVPRAQDQATVADHPLLAEVQLLIVHGLLHLYGYDHDTFESKTQMWALHKNLLADLGISINRLPED